MQRLPEVHIFDEKLAGWSIAAGNGFTCLVLNGDVNLCVSLCIDGVSHKPIRSSDIRCNGDIVDIRFRSRVEFDRALDACIVEKVKVRGIRDHFSQARNVFFPIHPSGARSLDPPWDGARHVYQQPAT